MKNNVQIAKASARQFMRDHYTDKKLVQVLDHARAGKFSFVSCCCFVGAVTANHALRGKEDQWTKYKHYDHAKMLEGAEVAEQAAARLSRFREYATSDDGLFQRRMIPMFLAEIKRRQYVAKASVIQSQESSVLQKA